MFRAKDRSRYVSGVSDADAPNVLQRDFCATKLNQNWVVRLGADVPAATDSPGLKQDAKYLV